MKYNLLNEKVLKCGLVECVGNVNGNVVYIIIRKYFSFFN